MNLPQADAASKTARTRPLVQGLVALSLLCLLIAIFNGIGWLESRKEVQALQTELQLAQCDLTDARQKLEAEQLIERRQLEMIKELQRTDTAQKTH